MVPEDRHQPTFPTAIAVLESIAPYALAVPSGQRDCAGGAITLLLQADN